jgi:uncharacterized paraquat-inducible protein A
VKTSVLIRILVIIVLLGGIGVVLVAPSEAGYYRKASFISALVLCILIIALGSWCVRRFWGSEESENAEEMELPPGVERCELCSKAIGRNQTPYVVKEHIVCEKCYRMIKEAKEDSE